MKKNTKILIKLLLGLWVCLEVFSFFYVHSHDRLFQKYYEPLDLKVDTMTFNSSNPDKKIGIDAYQNGDYKTAKIHLEKAFEKEPNNLAVTFGIGISYFENGNYEGGDSFFSERLHPDTGIAEISIWYQTVISLQYLKYWSREYIVKHKFEDLRIIISINKNYKESAENLRADLRSGKLKSILDWLDENSLQGRIKKRRYKNNIFSPYKGISNLDGFEKKKKLRWRDLENIDKNK